MNALVLTCLLTILAGGAPKAGDKAPDFRATALGDKARFELSKAIEKEKRPIVLVFGSMS